MSALSLPLPTIIRKARESELYLGDPKLLDVVAYCKGTYGNVLVLKDTVADEVPTPAAITFFGEVSRSGSFIRPYGAYYPGKFSNTSIDKAKIRMQIRDITNPKFKGILTDWKTYINNLHAIHRLNYEDDVPQISTPINNDEICISHALFQTVVSEEDGAPSVEGPSSKTAADTSGEVNVSVESGSDVGDDEQVLSQLTQTQRSNVSDNDTDNVMNKRTDDSDPSKPSPFSMDGWPVTGTWREEMLANRDTLQLMPLVLYDGVDDTAEPLGPHEYQKRLPGSVVKVVVTFESYKFTQHNMVAHIEEIRIIAPPSSVAASPSKRRFHNLVSNEKKAKVVKLA